MQPSFQIRSSEKDAIHYTECTLLIDAGERHLCFALYSSHSNEFVALEYYQFNAKQKQEQLKELLSSNTLLQLDYPSIYVYYNSASGLLVPERFYDQDTSSRMLELVAGNMHQNMPMCDEISVLNMRNVYTVPEYIRELVVSHFPNAVCEHIHTGLLRKNALVDRKSDRIEIIFYPELIILSVWKNNSLQIMQCFPYELPQDVSYHILNVARQWEMSPAETLVIASGLVEVSSDLFASVDRYFQFVETELRPEQFNYDEAFNAYPAHFFSPMFSLGLCVS